MAADSTFPRLSANSSVRGGTLRWLAPELLYCDDSENYPSNSPATDMYAFACVCYEVG